MYDKVYSNKKRGVYMEKYEIKSIGNGKIEFNCVQAQGECKQLDFNNISSLCQFLNDNIDGLDQFNIDIFKRNVYIRWHERDGQTHRVRSAELQFTKEVLIDDEFTKILDEVHAEFVMQSTALSVLKGIALHKVLSNSDYRIEHIYDYIKIIEGIYRKAGRIVTFGNAEADEKLLNLMKTKKHIICQKLEKDSAANNTAKGWLSKFGRAKSMVNEICFDEFYEAMSKKIEKRRFEVHWKDELIKIIAADLDYMKAHPELDYGYFYDELKFLMNIVTDTEVMDVVNLLKSLAYLEVEIYSIKSDGLGLKTKIDSPINRETILNRLKLMHYIELLGSHRDDYLERLLRLVDTVMETPFHGCEEELARLNRIVIDYASEFLNHLTKVRELDLQRLDEIAEEGRKEQETIERRLDTAKKYDELCGLLDEMEMHMRVDPIMMTTDQSMTMPF